VLTKQPLPYKLVRQLNAVESSLYPYHPVKANHPHIVNIFVEMPGIEPGSKNVANTSTNDSNINIISEPKDSEVSYAYCKFY
jgi:hypothetical protein